MQYQSIEYTDLFSCIKIASTENENAIETHALIELSLKSYTNCQIQFDLIEKSLLRLSQSEMLENASVVWKRYFVSDAINQSGLIKKETDVAVSVVQQAPLNGNKVAMFVYFVSEVSVEKTAFCLKVKRPDYEHLFHTQMYERRGDVVAQTGSVFDTYSRSLQENGCTLKDNAIRTWIYVQDVDVQYAGMVTARNNHFSGEGLTKDTHFIASTGIEGRYIYPEVLMLMEAYAINGIKEEQIKYLLGSSHLNPTTEYGVAFERATAVDYGDRRHVYISGTASINNKGEVVYPCDIEKQIERTLENINVLLAEADTGMEDVGQMIVYLRDTADYQIVREYFENNLVEIPKVIVWAPVCRPGWLIEIECIAIKKISNPEFRKF